MRVFIVAVRDEKVEEFMQLIGFRTEGEARRWFSDAVNKKEEGNMLRQHACDYSLYSFGWFDSTAGKFDLEALPTMLVNGRAVLVNEADAAQMRLQGVN